MKRGFSLLEVMVAAALSLVLLLVLTQALIPIMRSSSRAVDHMELSQLTNNISQRLLEDLQSAPFPAIQFPPTGNQTYFAVQPLERTTASGRPVYSEFLCVYSLNLDRGQLIRKRCYPTDLPLDHPSPFTAVQLGDFFQASPQPARTLVSEVLREFSLARVSPQRSQMIRLKFVLRSNSKQYNFDEVVALRNGDL